MNSYFKPFRRKLGVIAVVMGCVFAAGWVRSLSRYDHYMFPGKQTNDWLVSNRQQIGWMRWRLDSGKLMSNVGYASGWTSTPVGSVHPEMSEEGPRWQLIGFDYQHGDLPMGLRSSPVYVIHQIRIRVPYWSVVMPLTLLSAYLLLSSASQNMTGVTRPKTEVSATELTSKGTM